MAVALAEVGLEKMSARAEARLVGHARPLAAVVPCASFTISGFVLDAEPPLAPRLAGGDHDLAIARAEVHVEVVRPDLRHGQHAVDHLRLASAPQITSLPALADLRLELLGLDGKMRRRAERPQATRRARAAEMKGRHGSG